MTNREALEILKNRCEDSEVLKALERAIYELEYLKIKSYTEFWRDTICECEKDRRLDDYEVRVIAQNIVEDDDVMNDCKSTAQCFVDKYLANQSED